MDQIDKKIRILTVLCTLYYIPSIQSETLTYGHNFFEQRSQGNDFARRLVGVTPQFLAPCDTDCLNGYFGVVPSYMRSFDRDEVGDYFFFNGTNTMVFGAKLPQELMFLHVTFI